MINSKMQTGKIQINYHFAETQITDYLPLSKETREKRKGKFDLSFARSPGSRFGFLKRS